MNQNYKIVINKNALKFINKQDTTKKENFICHLWIT
ncbi:hypothetical protein HK1_01551 [Tepidibacillus sp. HK-1]|nr:hypothetical protein HK1_01551 [Tepidibacillus sp. HK-1]